MIPCVFSAGRFSWMFLAPMSAILKDGLRVDDLTCGNNLSEAVHEFSLCITNIVKIARENKEKCLPAVGNLCIIPYRRDEEKSLLQSQLVKFLDQLCGSHDFGYHWFILVFDELCFKILYSIYNLKGHQALTKKV